MQHMKGGFGSGDDAEYGPQFVYICTFLLNCTAVTFFIMTLTKLHNVEITAFLFFFSVLMDHFRNVSALKQTI